MKRYPLSGLLILASLVTARAQTAPPYGPPPAAVSDPEAFWSTPPATPEPYARERVWLSTDYLLWWVRKGPVNTPLLTTGSAQDALPGAVGQSGTQVLFGDRPLGFGASSGGGCRCRAPGRVGRCRARSRVNLRQCERLETSHMVDIPPGLFGAPKQSRICFGSDTSRVPVCAKAHRRIECRFRLPSPHQPIHRALFR
jgi:hypothetical protein